MVKLNGCTSETVELQNGCPQGSVLLPIIFTVFINTLRDCTDNYKWQIENITDNVQLSQIVDDSGIWLESGKPIISEKSTKSRKGHRKLACKYAFQINTSKMQVIIFLKGSVIPQELQTNFQKLTLCNKDLEYKEAITFLGMTFDKYLTWKQHINSLTKRCNSDINLMKAVKGNIWGTDKAILFKIYSALIRSKLWQYHL